MIFPLLGDSTVEIAEEINVFSALPIRPERQLSSHLELAMILKRGSMVAKVERGET